MKGFDYYWPKLKEDFMPQYAPWHIQAYSSFYSSTHDKKYSEYVLWLADGLIDTMLAHDPEALPDEVGRFYNPEYPTWGPPHSASTGVYLEGLTYAYAIAKERGDTIREKKYLRSILSATRSLLLVQWTPENAYFLASPQRAVGSFKISITDNRIRIDQIGHSANALTRVYTILSAQEK